MQRMLCLFRIGKVDDVSKLTALKKSHRPPKFPISIFCSHANSTTANMKRKLDANDVPSPEPAVGQEQETDFEALNLDPRLRQALIKEKFGKPTLVQAKAIPLALEGKDILGECQTDMERVAQSVLTRPARAKTGSGKTAAYVLPVLQSILQQKSVSLIRPSLFDVQH